MAACLRSCQRCHVSPRAMSSQPCSNHHLLCQPFSPRHAATRPRLRQLQSTACKSTVWPCLQRQQLCRASSRRTARVWVSMQHQQHQVAARTLPVEEGLQRARVAPIHAPCLASSRHAHSIGGLKSGIPPLEKGRRIELSLQGIFKGPQPISTAEWRTESKNSLSSTLRSPFAQTV